MTDGYLSRDRQHLAHLQRKRRAGMARIDYMPSRDALAVIEAKRGRYHPLNTNSGIIDAILADWAALIGSKQEVEPSKSSGNRPELGGQYARARMSSDAECPARVQDFGATSGVNAAIAGARTRAYDFEPPAKPRAEHKHQVVKRVPCGAKRHRDGHPCQGLSEPGKRRCRFHGGRSTGPRTVEGKARALANLRKGRVRPNT